MMGVLHSQQQQKKKVIEMLNLLVNIRKEFIRINSGVSFCVGDYVNKCNAAC